MGKSFRLRKGFQNLRRLRVGLWFGLFLESYTLDCYWMSEASFGDLRKRVSAIFGGLKKALDLNGELLGVSSGISQTLHTKLRWPLCALWGSLGLLQQASLFFGYTRQTSAESLWRLQQTTANIGTSFRTECETPDTLSKLRQTTANIGTSFRT